MKTLVRAIACSLLLCLTGLCAAKGSDAANDLLYRGFLNPPESARPRVWWHWMNGNITKEGIALDLRWMSQVGLGGVTIFQGSIDTPQVVKHRLVYMTPGWKEAFRYAVSNAHRYGFDVGIASSPGWSETGGPWVVPAHGMKKMVWSELRVDGGRDLSLILPSPAHTTGTFQDFRAEPAPGTPSLPEFYSDVAVIAYRAPADDIPQSDLRPVVTASGGQINAPALSDGDIQRVALKLPSIPNQDSWIRFEYPKPQQIQSVTMATLDDIGSIFDFVVNSPLSPRLQVSDDGITYRDIAQLCPDSIPQRTVSFPAVTARYFRVLFPAQPAEAPGAAPRFHLITELVLSPASRVNEFEQRAGFTTSPDYYAIATPAATKSSVVPLNSIVDVTSKMQPNGRLNWNAPPGKWIILRIGYSLTGHENGPAPAEATGLEVDELNRSDVREYVDGYLRTYADTVGPAMISKGGIGYLLCDSTEVGAQNWTNDIPTEFQNRRGYDPHPWLPALTGVIIKSPEATDRFLWDFRETIAELIAENHYGEISEELHRHGMEFYNEALEYHRPSLGDDMAMRRYADVPMGAMWTYTPDAGPGLTYIVDLRGAASVAHIYGQNLVGAESLTSAGPAWGFAPDNLKMIADLEFALGVNRFMIHESTLQPLVNRPPGLTLGVYGQWFNRNDTWAREARPWVTYLARNSYMLQQGHFVADVAYFYGQEGPLTALYGWKAQQDAPRGYGFDFVDSDVILHRLKFKNGRLVTSGGTSYRILYCGGRSSKMTLNVLHRLQELVAAGAVLAGEKPVSSPSLADDPAQVRQIADELWGTTSGDAPSVHAYGKGYVYSGMTPDAVLAALKLPKDFSYTSPDPDAELMFVHRKLADGDLYYMDNRKNRAENVDLTFRVLGKEPELWYPDTGQRKAASYRISGGETTIPLRMDPYETLFVLFRRNTQVMQRTVPVPKKSTLAVVKGPWTVMFQPDRGAPEEVTFPHLTSWSLNSNPGVRYFSGTATYNKTIYVNAKWLRPGVHILLDLGSVKEIADVKVNGQEVGIAWKSPYNLDVERELHSGANRVQISVTNLWVNRLIGDQQLGTKVKYTFTDFRPYGPDSPLRSSGLLGPIRLLSETLK